MGVGAASLQTRQQRLQERAPIAASARFQLKPTGAAATAVCDDQVELQEGDRAE